MLCPRQDGTNASYGETETFYEYCPNTLYCNGQIGSIAIGYNWKQGTQPPTTRNFSCLQNDLVSDFVTLAPCDLSMVEQQFRLVQNVAGNTLYESTVSEQGMNGTMLRIQHLATGQCVGTNNSNVLLYDCTALPNNGFVWGIIPQTQFDDQDICKNNFPTNSPSDIANYNACITASFNQAKTVCSKKCVNKCKNKVSSCAAPCGGGTCGVGCCDPQIGCQ